MAQQSFMDKILRRARTATSDADLNMLKDEMEGKVPSDLMNKPDDDGDNDMDDTGGDGIHMHVHLPNGSNGGSNGGSEDPMMEEDPGEPDMGGGGDLADLSNRLAALEQKVAELMDGDEGEVELQNPGDAQDAKRYIMRRGSRLKAHDEEEIPIPERQPEVIGETDLPGVEDLDARTHTGDRVPQELLWQETMAKGEIIVPGIRIPTFDSRVKAGVTAQRLCSFRRQTMDAALEADGARDVLAGLVGIKTKDQVKSMTCDTLKMAFEATANAMGARNNSFIRSSVADSLPGYRQNQNSGSATLGEIQRRNREAWKTGEFKPIH